MKGSEGRLPLNEMCFTALARLAAAQGDADRAFQLAQARGAGAWPAGRVAGAHTAAGGLLALRGGAGCAAERGTGCGVVWAGPG